MRFEVSSKATKMPGSLQSWAPCTRNCSANTVLPEPGPPTSNVVRPRGKPPPVISSNPVMPVSTLFGTFATGN
nr:F506 [uncultured bacterium]